ncbi:hypothetical protein [Paenibacillus sp. 1-18]|nr:hypothetical protein [Paenibacillus sp. 1-18]
MKKVYYALGSAVVASLILTAVPVAEVYAASAQQTKSTQTILASSLKGGG